MREGSRQVAGSAIRDGDGDGLHKFSASVGLGFGGPQMDGRVARDARRYSSTRRRRMRLPSGIKSGERRRSVIVFGISDAIQ